MTTALTVALLATLLLCAGVVVAMGWLLLKTIDLLANERALVKDLLNRLQARNLGEYQALNYSSNGHEPTIPRPESRLYDPSGLLSVPLDDRLED